MNDYARIIPTAMASLDPRRKQTPITKEQISVITRYLNKIYKPHAFTFQIVELVKFLCYEDVSDINLRLLDIFGIYPVKN